MVIGICKLVLRLPENHSLKGKRQVTKSIIAKVRSKFNVAVAEVDGSDLWQMATLGVVAVTNDAKLSHQILSSVVSFIQHNLGDAEMVDYETEVLRV